MCHLGRCPRRPRKGGANTKPSTSSSFRQWVFRGLAMLVGDFSSSPGTLMSYLLLTRNGSRPTTRRTPARIQCSWLLARITRLVTLQSTSSLSPPFIKRTLTRRSRIDVFEPSCSSFFRDPTPSPRSQRREQIRVPVEILDLNCVPMILAEGMEGCVGWGRGDTGCMPPHSSDPENLVIPDQRVGS